MKIWADLLNYSVGLAALLVLAICGLGLMLVVTVAVVLSKLWSFVE